MNTSPDKVSKAADAANIISEFVAHEQVCTLSDLQRALFGSSATKKQLNFKTSSSSAAVVVLCGSAILSIIDTVVSSVTKLVEAMDEAVVLVITGGIGHSTQLLYDAVARHPKYNRITGQVQGQPEARVFQTLVEQFFHLEVEQDNLVTTGKHPTQRLSILIEDASTNCALNAVYTRKILDQHGYTSPCSIVVAQDPTMCRRTVAAFEQVYSDKIDDTPVFASWPTFVPRVAVQDSGAQNQASGLTSYLRYDIADFDKNQNDGLWSMERLMSLLVGEIPRMTDNENGYGPRGKGSIVHVDIPQDVEDAWIVLGDTLGQKMR
ncbi:related to DUF218 domain protein [Fusarium mangiferae]|uniref:Related to DUF218 domain protein n=1 Tax=Fusarium mangiferae TaxID=192010 RepID=A0A1L7TZ04_FUSMA|nr:uncharacterized protein FMAN_00527 [Fusarium mangiferae]CVL03269.1 related to DUF218 domain protein [Fusarium mangiferae]